MDILYYVGGIKINSTIVALKVDERDDFAPNVQEILTSYGHNIKTRLGLHNHDQNQGLIIVEFLGSENDLNNFEEELKKVDLLNFKKMELNF